MFAPSPSGRKRRPIPKPKAVIVSFIKQMREHCGEIRACQVLINNVLNYHIHKPDVVAQFIDVNASVIVSSWLSDALDKLKNSHHENDRMDLRLLVASLVSLTAAISAPLSGSNKSSAPLSPHLKKSIQSIIATHAVAAPYTSLREQCERLLREDASPLSPAQDIDNSVSGFKRKRVVKRSVRWPPNHQLEKVKTFVSDPRHCKKRRKAGGGGPRLLVCAEIPWRIPTRINMSARVTVSSDENAVQVARVAERLECVFFTHAQIPRQPESIPHVNHYRDDDVPHYDALNHPKSDVATKPELHSSSSSSSVVCVTRDTAALVNSVDDVDISTTASSSSSSSQQIHSKHNMMKKTLSSSSSHMDVELLSQLNMMVAKNSYTTPSSPSQQHTKTPLQQHQHVPPLQQHQQVPLQQHQPVQLQQHQPMPLQRQYQVQQHQKQHHQQQQQHPQKFHRQRFHEQQQQQQASSYLIPQQPPSSSSPSSSPPPPSSSSSSHHTPYDTATTATTPWSTPSSPDRHTHHHHDASIETDTNTSHLHHHHHHHRHHHHRSRDDKRQRDEKFSSRGRARGAIKARCDGERRKKIVQRRSRNAGQCCNDVVVDEFGRRRVVDDDDDDDDECISSRHRDDEFNRRFVDDERTLRSRSPAASRRRADDHEIMQRIPSWERRQFNGSIRRDNEQPRTRRASTQSPHTHRNTFTRSADTSTETTLKATTPAPMLMMSTRPLQNRFSALENLRSDNEYSESVVCSHSQYSYHHENTFLRDDSNFSNALNNHRFDGNRVDVNFASNVRAGDNWSVARNSMRFDSDHNNNNSNNNALNFARNTERFDTSRSRMNVDRNHGDRNAAVNARGGYASNSKRNNVNPRNRTCRNFATQRGCSRGESCFFKHDANEATRGTNYAPQQFFDGVGVEYYSSNP